MSRLRAVDGPYDAQAELVTLGEEAVVRMCDVSGWMFHPPLGTDLMPRTTVFLVGGNELYLEGDHRKALLFSAKRFAEWRDDG